MVAITLMEVISVRTGVIRKGWVIYTATTSSKRMANEEFICLTCFG